MSFDSDQEVSALSQEATGLVLRSLSFAELDDVELHSAVHDASSHLHLVVAVDPSLDELIVTVTMLGDSGLLRTDVFWLNALKRALVEHSVSNLNTRIRLGAFEVV